MPESSLARGETELLETVALCKSCSGEAYRSGPREQVDDLALHEEITICSRADGREERSLGAVDEEDATHPRSKQLEHCQRVVRVNEEDERGAA